MAPIRTAIIGLSANAITNWAKVAHLPYLLSPAGREKFTIVALLNSSTEAAKKAIADFGLPSETLAYGDSESLAADRDIDLVICATRVDKHYETVLPSVRAGKDVFVEWPLAENVARATELADLAQKSGSRTVVGLQGWFAPAVAKLKEVIESGRIGKVLSSEVRAAGGSLKSRDSVPAGLKYFTDSRIGGNPYTIGFGHLFDYVQFVLGDIQNDSTNSYLQIQRPELDVRDPETGRVLETVRSDVPDLVYFTGTLPGSDTVAGGATLHLAYRKNPPAFKGEAPMVWTISGEKGDLRLVALGGPAIHASAHADGIFISLHDFDTEEVHDIEWIWSHHLDISPIARNVGALYDSYAAGDASKYPGFSNATKRHEQLDQALRQFTTNK